VAVEQLAANGVNLSSPWSWVEDMAPLMVTAGRRGENMVVPGRHGTIRTPRKRYDGAEFVVPVWVLGVDQVTGATVANPVSQLRRNVDDMLRIFTTETVELAHTSDDGLVRSATVELAQDPVVVERQRSSPPAARVAFALSLPSAFWEDGEDVTQTFTSGGPVALTNFAAATAPMQDLILTFGPCNNPTLRHGNRTFTYNGVVAAGQQLVVNTANWLPSSGTGTPWSPDIRKYTFDPGPALFELDPTLTPFQVQLTHTGTGTATCTITGKRKYLAP
jgi:hypothetical protein